LIVMTETIDLLLDDTIVQGVEAVIESEVRKTMKRLVEVRTRIPKEDDHVAKILNHLGKARDIIAVNRTGRGAVMHRQVPVIPIVPRLIEERNHLVNPPQVAKDERVVDQMKERNSMVIVNDQSTAEVKEKLHLSRLVRWHSNNL